MKGLPKWVGVGLSLALSVFLSPVALANTIYVSTFNDNTIYAINSSGSVSVFATAASGLNYPAGLALNSSGNLYVANSGGGNGNSTIEEFDPSGNGSIFASENTGEFFGLAFDSSGNLYDLNTSTNAIEEFDPSGNESIFATPSPGAGVPIGLAFDSSGNLYAAGSTTIEEYDPSGHASVFANSGLSNPTGIAYYGGNLYVANYGDNTIEEFNSSGQGSIFTSTNLVNEPIGLAFDSNGNLFVANQHNGDILEFNQDGIGSVFASGLGNAVGIAIDEIPEPSSLLLLGLGLCALAVSHRPRRRR